MFFSVYIATCDAPLGLVELMSGDNHTEMKLP